MSAALRRDRTKLLGFFWVRLKTMGLTPTAVLRHSNLPLTLYSKEGQVTTAQLFVLWRYTNFFYRAFRTWEGRTPAEWRATPRETKAKLKLAGERRQGRRTNQTKS